MPWSSRNKRYGYGGSEYRGRGSRGRGWHSASTETRDIHIPDNAGGMIIGVKGSNIKELQAMPGIDSVRLDNKVSPLILRIGGQSKDDVDAVEFKVRYLLNKFITSGSGNRECHLHYDMDIFLCVKFSPAKSANALTKLGDFSAHISDEEMENNCIVTQNIQEEEALDAQFRDNLQIYRQFSSTKKVKNSVYAPLDIESMVEAFTHFLTNQAPQHAQSDDKHVAAEIRLGFTIFHSICDGGRGSLTVKGLTNFTVGVDYRTQFSVSIKLKSEELERVLKAEGFDMMERGSGNTLVHLVDCVNAKGYVVRFAEVENPEGSKTETDPRLSTEKRKELERIAACKTFAEILQVKTTDSPTTAKKAYFKKSMIVHPDKNAFPGATEAMKYIGLAREVLVDKKSYDIPKPPIFEIGSIDTNDVPKIVRFVERKVSHARFDVVKMDGKLGFRVDLTSQSLVNNPTGRRFLEEAWKKGEIKAEGILTADRKYSIDSVRIKDRVIYSDGEFMVSIESVQQKATRTNAKFTSFPEVIVECPALQHMIDQLKCGQNTKDKDAYLRKDAARLFQEMVVKANLLADKINKEA